MGVQVVSLQKRQAVALALEYLRRDDLVVVPTDTVYGIACYPTPRAIERLYQVKEREPEPALPLLLASAEVTAEVAYLAPTARSLMRQFWPGPLTLIVPARPVLARQGLSARVGVRWPQAPLLWPLLEAAGGYLVVSSTMRGGYPPAVNAQEAVELLGDAVGLVLDGGPGLYGVPSTIVDCTQDPPLLIRRGSISEAEIFKALGIESGR